VGDSGVGAPGRRRRLPSPDEQPTEIIHFEDELEPEGVLEEDGYADYADDDEYDEYDDDFYDDEDYDDEDYDEAERAEPEYIEDVRPTKPRRRKRFFGWVAALSVIALLLGGAWYGFNAIFGYSDFTGAGQSDVIVQVADGDSTNAIAGKLVDAGVVASTKAFVKASANNSAVTKVQPGYYELKTKMSGASAVTKLVDSASRVGQLQIRAGTQLEDITQPDGKITPGVYTLLSKASCAQLNGKSTCIPADELRRTAATADLAALGAPSWAAAPAAAAGQTDRRLEGLIAPGVYDVKPGLTAIELLTNVVKASALQLQSAGLTSQAGISGQTPYQTLVIASIIEREGVVADFGKVSRVVYNRLATNMRLRMDSTVNYLLDRPVITTTDADRAKPGPYNTYLNNGLTPTPIGAPSPEAIQAALQPSAGAWLYFVKCETNGLSCFAVTYADQIKNQDDARARGVY
jgi:UPF0755 protein